MVFPDLSRLGIAADTATKGENMLKYLTDDLLYSIMGKLDNIRDSKHYERLQIFCKQTGNEQCPDEFWKGVVEQLFVNSLAYPARARDNPAANPLVDDFFAKYKSLSLEEENINSWKDIVKQVYSAFHFFTEQELRELLGQESKIRKPPSLATSLYVLYECMDRFADQGHADAAAKLVVMAKLLFSNVKLDDIEVFTDTQVTVILLVETALTSRALNTDFIRVVKGSGVIEGVFNNALRIQHETPTLKEKMLRLLAPLLSESARKTILAEERKKEDETTAMRVLNDYNNLLSAAKDNNSFLMDNAIHSVHNVDYENNLSFEEAFKEALRCQSNNVLEQLAPLLSDDARDRMFLLAGTNENFKALKVLKDQMAKTFRSAVEVVEYGTYKKKFENMFEHLKPHMELLQSRLKSELLRSIRYKNAFATEALLKAYEYSKEELQLALSEASKIPNGVWTKEYIITVLLGNVGRVPLTS